MRKVCFVLAAGALAFSGAVTAASLEEGFRSRGECQKWINYDAWYAKLGMPNPLGVYPPNPRCEKIDGVWYIVAG